MYEALLECATDLYRLIDQGAGESVEADELRSLMRYYFATLTADEKQQVITEIVRLRREGRG